MQTTVSRTNNRTPVNNDHVQRRATPHDAEIGRRVRARRLELHLSQTELGERCGVTFQQVQKYEKGVNRIGAGRLQRISEALEVQPSFFFDAQPSRVEKAHMTESVLGLVSNGGSARILQAYHKIKSRKARQLIVELAEVLAG